MTSLNNLLINHVWGSNELSPNGDYLINHAFQFIVSNTVLAYRPEYTTFETIDYGQLRKHINKKLGHGRIGESYDMAHHYLNSTLAKNVPDDIFAKFRKDLTRATKGFRQEADIQALFTKYGVEYKLPVTKFGATVVREWSTPQNRVNAYYNKLTQHVTMKVG